jgi:3D (Asp-Asp-Asp) domain-containing protein
MTLSNINEFEHLMDDATVATNYTADVLDGATVDGTSSKEEEELLEMARDDLDLQLKSSLSIDFPKLNNAIDKPVTASRGADLF